VGGLDAVTDGEGKRERRGRRWCKWGVLGRGDGWWDGGSLASPLVPSQEVVTDEAWLDGCFSLVIRAQIIRIKVDITVRLVRGRWF